jgi:hypothetical protein
MVESEQETQAELDHLREEYKQMEAKLATMEAEANAAKKPSTSLATKKNEELGKALITEARKKYDQTRQEKVIAEVERHMASRDEYRAKIVFANRAIEWYDAKLQAMEEGEFDFDEVGRMIFRNEDFQRSNF